MENTQEEEKKPVTFYGKKAYYLNPLIARQKPADGNKTDYWFEDIEETKAKKF